MSNDLSQPAGRTGRGASALLEALRPHHWVKNAFVVAPILFSGRFDDWHAWLRCLPAVAAFCLLSSAVYLINDIADRRLDAAHPIKRNRPIPSGRLSVGAAAAAGVVTALAGVAIVAGHSLMWREPAQPLGGLGLAAWSGLYLALNLLYSFWLKNHAIVDVLVVALGFVLRAMAGAAAIAVPVSPWLVLCTLTLCLFIAVAKRRGELAEMPDQSHQARFAQAGYDLPMLEHMLAVSASCAILTYCLYCLAPRTVAHLGSGNMIWTIPLVIYGTFRYYRSVRRAGVSDALELLVRDRVLWLVVAAYAALSAAVVKYGSLGGVKNILDI